LHKIKINSLKFISKIINLLIKEVIMLKLTPPDT
jgi:hypothetical protein